MSTERHGLVIHSTDTKFLVRLIDWLNKQPAKDGSTTIFDMPDGEIVTNLLSEVDRLRPQVPAWLPGGARGGVITDFKSGEWYYAIANRCLDSVFFREVERDFYIENTENSAYRFENIEFLCSHDKFPLPQ